MFTQIRVGPVNPAYPRTKDDISAALDRMRADPVGLARPLVVLSGYRSPSGAASLLADKIARATGADRDADILVLSYPFADSIEHLGQRVAAAVEARWPSDDPAHTTEVDVVAISMGGLVARLAELPFDDQAALAHAAGRPLPAPSGKRLNIRALYTLGSPHRGAVLAELVALDPAARSMLRGSPLLSALDARVASRPAATPEPKHQPTTMTIVPYAVLNDRWVGATRAAPHGQDPIWIPGRAFLSHHLISTEPRILADLCARLRGEAPLAEPSAPPHD